MEYKIFYRNKFIPNKSISVPYFNMYKEQEETANLLKNNFYTEEQKKNILNYLKNKFFLNNNVLIILNITNLSIIYVKIQIL